jgi:DNA-binding MarR family transcriptional regulator
MDNAPVSALLRAKKYSQYQSKLFGYIVYSTLSLQLRYLFDKIIMKEDLLIQIRKLNQQYAYTSIQMHEAIGRKAGLSGTDHKYLGFLIVKGQMTAGELSNLTGLTTGAITGLIDRFEKKNLVKRQFAQGDRRKVIIEPNTENIMALFAPLYKDYRSKSEKLTASFSDNEIKIIEAYFSKSIEIMTETINELNNK